MKNLFTLFLLFVAFAINAQTIEKKIINQQITTQIYQDDTSLIVPVLAGSSYKFSYRLLLSGHDSVGLNYRITCPPGAMVHYLDMDGDSECDSTEQYIRTTQSKIRFIKLDGIVETGANSGVINIQYKKANDGVSVVIRKNSSLSYKKQE